MKTTTAATNSRKVYAALRDFVTDIVTEELEDRLRKNDEDKLEEYKKLNAECKQLGEGLAKLKETCELLTKRQEAARRQASATEDKVKLLENEAGKPWAHRSWA